jgi:hypothetical protein
MFDNLSLKWMLEIVYTGGFISANSCGYINKNLQIDLFKNFTNLKRSKNTILNGTENLKKKKINSKTRLLKVNLIFV